MMSESITGPVDPSDGSIAHDKEPMVDLIDRLEHWEGEHVRLHCENGSIDIEITEANAYARQYDDEIGEVEPMFFYVGIDLTAEEIEKWLDESFSAEYTIDTDEHLWTNMVSNKILAEDLKREPYSWKYDSTGWSRPDFGFSIPALFHEPREERWGTRTGNRVSVSDYGTSPGPLYTAEPLD